MEAVKIAKQLIEVQKTTLDNAFDAMVALQDQAEKMTTNLVDQAVWIPADGKKALGEWIGVLKQGRDNLKKALDEGYATFGAFVDVSAKAPKASAK